MNYAEIRRILLWSFIVFLVLTAVVAIVSVVFTKFGVVQLKVLVTTFTISTASICALVCATFIEKKGPGASGRVGIWPDEFLAKLAGVLGMVGVLAAALGAILVVSGFWSEAAGVEFWKTSISVLVVAFAMAHAFSLRLAKLSEAHRWVQEASSITIAILALQIILAVWEKPASQGYYIFLAVVSILVALLTLVVPICHLLRRKN